MRVAIQAKFELFGTLKKQGGWYIAHCPPLDITTQGKTAAEAKKNLVEASELFVLSCLERGTFEQALRELGWSVEGGANAVRQKKRNASAIPAGAFRFPIPVPFGFEKAAGCPA